jgi:putative transposase
VAKVCYNFGMGTHLLKRHNKTLLMYHIVSTIKYRKSLFSDEVSNFLKEICLEIEQRYDIFFLSIGTDQNHVHFLVQAAPKLSVSKIVQIIKGNLSKQIFIKFPDFRKQLWGGEFWTDGYYANTVSQYGGEYTITRYIQNQGKNDKTYKLNSNYKEIHKSDSFNLFEEFGF